VHHLLQNGRPIVDNDIAHHFLQDHFLHWIESLSVLGKLSDGVLSVRKLLHIVRVCL
jgi:hypothetical protein